jgi:iron(III) transport system substrate-binding protein
MTPKLLRPKLAAVGLAVLGVTALAACGATKPSTTGATAASSGATAASSGATAASSGEKVPLDLYAAEGYDQAECNAFQAKTGITCNLTDHSTGTLLTTIAATVNNPHWGVFWSDGDESYAALDQQGLLVKGFEPTSGTLNTLGQSLVPADKAWIPTGVTIACGIVYNSKTTSTAPTNWTQLLQPQYKGEVGMNNPALSGPTYPFVAGIMQQLGGVSQGEAFFKSLKANGLHVFSTNKVTLTALLQGQIRYAIVQNSAGIGFMHKYPNLRVAYPAKSSVLPSVIGIDAKVSPTEIAEAEQFANFVYSPAGQAVMLSGDPFGDSLFVPIVNGTVGHSEVPALSSLPTQVVNPLVWGPRESSINQWFTANIVS